MDALVDPPFARDFPLKLDGKIVGIVIAVLAAMSLFFGIIAALALFGIGATATATGAPVNIPIALLGTVAGAVAAVLSLRGGWQMWKGDAAGKRPVVYGLALNFVSNIIFGIGTSIANQIVPMIIIAVVYLIVVASRFGASPTTSGSRR